MSWFTRQRITADDVQCDWDDFYREMAKQAMRAPARVVDPIESASDDVLILELIKRGYAVGRLNENNQLDTTDVA